MMLNLTSQLEDSATCPQHMSENATLRALHAAVDLCPSPFYRLREIHPRHLVWTEPDEDEDADSEEHSLEPSSSSGTAPARSGGGGRRNKAAASDPNNSFVGFLMSARGEYFSQEMEAVVAALAPAFPGVWFVRAEGAEFTRFTAQYMVVVAALAPAFPGVWFVRAAGAEFTRFTAQYMGSAFTRFTAQYMGAEFTRFTAQYMVRGFPRLLLFKGGRLQGQYRGERHAATVAAWLAALSDQLPRAAVLPPRAPPPRALRLDDARLWAAAAYVALNVLLFALRRRWPREAAPSAGDERRP
ncbi:hypothetical protein JKP88DRAFT_308058 [Tribonema minus]|uniref:Uncharacterized protein n=1 Tax=Tribonema minus TaxID=303371 RepID=A0A835Z5C9_9STRA|nr:hypothetical protein JKP88DRAFT_308058 [Tribonema minus]